MPRSEDPVEKQLRAQLKKPLDKKVLQLRVAKILAKQQAGKLLSKREQLELDTFAGASPSSPQDWVSSDAKLSDLFGPHRASFPRFRKQYADAPKPRANGDHSVSAWRAFFATHPELLAKSNPGDLPEKNLLERKILEGKLALQEIEIAERRGQFIKVTEARAWATQMAGEFRKVLESVPSTLAPDIVGIATIPEAELRIRAAIDQALAMLHSAPWSDREPKSE